MWCASYAIVAALMPQPPLLEKVRSATPAELLTSLKTSIPEELATSLEATAVAVKAGDAAGAMDALQSVGPVLPALLALGAATSIAAGVASTILPPPPTSLLEGTILEQRKLRRIYKASADGWSAVAFHRNVDFSGPSVVMCRSSGGVFGGFNPRGWASTDDYAASTTAFLFVQMPRSGEWVKLRKIGGAEAAIFDYARSGPHFGSNALIIGATQAAVMGGFTGPDTMGMEAAGNLRRASSQLGLSYERGPPPYRASIFGGAKLDASLSEVEVWAAAR